MGEVVTYANDFKQKFCQVKFSDGNRILISIARDGIKILKMRFFGAIPANLIFNLKAEELEPGNNKHSSALERLAKKTKKMTHMIA